MPHRAITSAIVLALALVRPGLASAQGFGLGPRMSFIQTDLLSNTPAAKLWGGTLRMRPSPRVGVELALDYRSQVSPDGFSRLKERPFQGSILLFPFRGAFAPYVLAGYGIYHQTIEMLSGTGMAESSVSTQKSGAHAGFGTELFLTRHTAFFLDYRYRFVHFGSAQSNEEPLNIPGASLVPGLSHVQLSHQGSMVTSGVAFYF
jgi:hypothetical protein